ncbi:MAG TPA: hypothetical protein DIT07_15535 [Sphingobacteriaceae bacterium]|nr:hypothetical protein [Sphingobacteriaceae bacterium]
MKNLILIFSLITLSATVSFAQCDKKVKFTSSKTDHLDSGGNITRTQQEDAVVQISKSEVTITVSGESRGAFIIKSITCDWKVPFKEGKTTIRASMDDLTVSLTFEGKGGKVTAQFVAEGHEDDVIRVVADKFEEEI